VLVGDPHLFLRTYLVY